MVDDAHDDLVEELRRAGDHVEVAVGDRVVGAGTDGDAGIRCHQVDADQGVAVAAFVVDGQVELQGRAAIALGHDPRRGASTAANASESSRPSAGASRYGGSRKTRSYASPRADASRRAARAGPAPTGLLRAEPEASRLARMTATARASRSTRRPFAHPATAPRCPVRPSPRTGRARERRRAARASRTAPRARGRRSAACPAPAAPAAGARRSARPRPSRRHGPSRPPRARRPAAPCSGACRLGVLVEQRGRPAWARSRTPRPRAAARSESAPGRTGACPSARPRRAARGRSRPVEPSLVIGQRRWRGGPGAEGRHRGGENPRPTRPRSWCSWERP